MCFSLEACENLFMDNSVSDKAEQLCPQEETDFQTSFIAGNEHWEK